jgi:hypothetical protein
MDCAERLARRKLLAETYNRLPSPKTLSAAADLEHAEMQHAAQHVHIAARMKTAEEKSA